ncbi:MAG: hypothetical protein ACREV5_02535 [Steroidobacter sp.]
MWRRIRIAILLLILMFVGLNTYFDRVYSTDWNIPLRVAVYPINGDGSDEAERFIRERNDDDYRALESFFETEAAHYGLTMERPVRFSTVQQLRESPPAIAPGAGALKIARWSLRTRYWAWRTPEASGPPPDIKVFLLYHDPQRTPSLPHSTGLQKGLFAIVNAFADRGMLGSNDTVIAHELLHTLGATDKYELRTNQPTHPNGFAEPERQPLYPQSFAEVMGGRIPVSATEATMPESLRQVVVGATTAAEIGWSPQ